jgi:hypothetical protein
MVVVVEAAAVVVERGGGGAKECVCGGDEDISPTIPRLLYMQLLVGYPGDDRWVKPPPLATKKVPFGQTGGKLECGTDYEAGAGGFPKVSSRWYLLRGLLRGTA